MRGAVPAIVAVGCIHWYGAYRSNDDPNEHLIASLLGLEDAWLQDFDHRPRLEAAMRAAAVSLVGEHPKDLLDVAV